MAFSEETFPVDDYLQKKADFWKRVYSQVTTTEGFLHDENDLNIVYEKISLKGLSEKAQDKKIKEEKKRWREVITSVIKNEPLSLSPEEKIIVARIKDFPKKRLEEMSLEIRFQSGLSDRFLHGLEESYKYLDEIRDEFKEMGLPQDLAFLPHVESSFNYKAYSKVGAAGIWQFMWHTARLYKLKRDFFIDERRDPLVATKAAAKLLRDNYGRFKSWPLAITAYNSGPNSMARAMIKTRSKDLSKILENYDRGNFGFASKNFYACFLAALEISKKPERFFGKFQKKSHPSFEVYRLPERSRISRVAKIFDLELEDLENHNLALRPYVFKNDVSLPKGFSLKIPKNVFDKANMAKISEEKSIKRAIASSSDSYKIKVEPNETLGHYADWSLIPKEKILESNKSKNILVGMTLELSMDEKALQRFLKKRAKFHFKIQKDFFKKHKINGLSKYEVQKGDTLEKITDKLDIPIWLIKKYQKTDVLKEGEILKVPKIVEVNE